jgi:hypothetical protein
MVLFAGAHFGGFVARVFFLLSNNSWRTCSTVFSLWYFLLNSTVRKLLAHPSSNLLTRWPIRASEARLYIFVRVLLLSAPMRFYSEKIIRSYSASRINLARSATKPSLDTYSSEAFFFFPAPRPTLAFYSKALFSQGLVQIVFREAFELSIGCIRRGFLWTSKTVFWALPNQWTLALRCAFQKSPSELYKITVLCLLVFALRRGIMLLFYTTSPPSWGTASCGRHFVFWLPIKPFSVQWRRTLRLWF